MSFRGSPRQRQDDSFLAAVFGILIGFSDWFCNSRDSVQLASDEFDPIADRYEDELSYEEMADIEDLF